MKALIVIILCISIEAAVNAEEFRRINLIATPAALPPGAKPVEEMRPIEHEVIEGAVQKLANSYSHAGLRDMIDDRFYDKSRLMDSMSNTEKVPPDVQLRLISLQGGQTLSQYTTTDPSGRQMTVSTVSATMRTQIEFNDSQRGFQSIEGTNEVIFEITTQME